VIFSLECGNDFGMPQVQLPIFPAGVTHVRSSHDAQHGPGGRQRRIPEVRTLRQKITELCADPGDAERWSTALAKQWMAEEPESAGSFTSMGMCGFIMENHRSASALCGAGAALFARHDRLLGQPIGRVRNRSYS
jgi:hypothetical protein